MGAEFRWDFLATLFKNGFRADRLSCHRFLANAFRLLLHGFAYNLVNLFRLLELPPEWRSAPIETLRTRLFKVGARVRKGLDRRGANRERV
ncbi:MAG: hypothetical protein DMG26_08970 [Acidobacteria bacterium]|nr:MAG: hypothetical protein DMG26_08970 [Acidobacteriota bacterium]